MGVGPEWEEREGLGEGSWVGEEGGGGEVGAGCQVGKGFGVEEGEVERSLTGRGDKWPQSDEGGEE